MTTTHQPIGSPESDATDVPRNADSPDRTRAILATMWRIRRFEEAVDDLFARGLMHGTMHLSIGQEASATGACLGLRTDDAITSTHRGHGHCIAKGADLDADDGRTARQGDRLLPRPRRLDAHRRRRHRATSAPTASSAAASRSRPAPRWRTSCRGSDRVVVSFFGDGATNEGAFHEAVNLAAIWKLPVVFVCENNQYGMSFSTE